MTTPRLRAGSQILLFLASILAISSALAQEFEVCSPMQPCRVTQPVTVGEQTTVSLVWRGQAVAERFADIRSDVGYFTLSDPTSDDRLGLVQRPLSERAMASPDGLVTIAINETLTVPAEVSLRAAERNQSQLLFVRQFDINGITVTGVQTIRLSQPPPKPEPEPQPEPQPSPGPQPTPEPEPRRFNPNATRSLQEGQDVTASGLLVRRVALRFDDGGPVASVDRDEQLRARANIHYDRAGLLEAIWEVATPATTRGQPVFRRLDNVRQYLGAGQQATLQSPVLPSNEAGLYLLRLRLIQPRFEQEAIELRYQVSSQSATPEFVPVLRVSQPAVGARLGTETSFQWQRIPQTQAYQLEFYERPPTASAPSTQTEPNTAEAEMADAPSTGMLVRGDTNSTRLSPAVLQRLSPGRVYYWRAVSVNAEGTIVAASPIQTIQTEE